MMKTEFSGEKGDERRRYCCYVRKEKMVGRNKGIRYKEARKTSKHITRRTEARTHTYLIQIFMDYSYKRGIMTQDHGPCPHNTNVDEK